jgi:hypothetical protein
MRDAWKNAARQVVSRFTVAGKSLLSLKRKFVFSVRCL